MERKYEVMFILRPDVAAEEADKLIAGFEATIAKGNGKLVSSEKLGNRKLAYTVRKFNEGNYNLLTVEADGSLVAELERRLRVTEPVIKFITVRMDEEEKRINKIRKLRSTRVKQSTLNAQSAHAASAAAQQSAVQPGAVQPGRVETPENAAPAPEAIA